ncbi:MAG: phosphatase PAP2 family protein [Egibacteraceae bacterium]
MGRLESDRWRWAVLLGCIVVLLALAWAGSAPYPLAWAHELVPARTLMLDPLMALFTLAGGGAGLLLLGAVAFGVLLAHRRVAEAAFLAVSLEGARVLGRLLKHLLGRPRPPSARAVTLPHPPHTQELLVATVLAVLVILALTRRRRGAPTLVVTAFLAALAMDLVAVVLIPLRPGYDSFPSGHAVGAAALAAPLVVLAWPTRRRWLVTVTACLFAFFVGISRVYFSLHYPVDVAAGWLLAIAWVTLVLLAFDRGATSVWPSWRPVNAAHRLEGRDHPDRTGAPRAPERGAPGR